MENSANGFNFNIQPTQWLLDKILSASVVIPPPEKIGLYGTTNTIASTLNDVLLNLEENQKLVVDSLTIMNGSGPELSMYGGIKFGDFICSNMSQLNSSTADYFLTTKQYFNIIIPKVLLITIDNYGSNDIMALCSYHVE